MIPFMEPSKPPDGTKPYKWRRRNEDFLQIPCIGHGKEGTNYPGANASPKSGEIERSSQWV